MAIAIRFVGKFPIQSRFVSFPLNLVNERPVARKTMEVICIAAKTFMLWIVGMESLFGMPGLIQLVDFASTVFERPAVG